MAQKVNPISVRLNLNRSSDPSWFSDYYYGKLLYQDFNFRDYFGSIRPPTGNTFGFRIGRCIIHHFPKRTFIHVFFLDGQSSRHQQEGLSKRKNNLLGGIPSSYEKEAFFSYEEERMKKQKRVGGIGIWDGCFPFRIPCRRSKIDQLLRVSDWMDHLMHYFSIEKSSIPPKSNPPVKKDKRIIATGITAGRASGSEERCYDALFSRFAIAPKQPVAVITYEPNEKQDMGDAAIFLDYFVMQYFFQIRQRLFDPMKKVRTVRPRIPEKHDTEQGRREYQTSRSTKSKKTKQLLYFFDAIIFLRYAAPRFKEATNLSLSSRYYLIKMQSLFPNRTLTNTLIQPVKIAAVYQSASPIAQEISWKLEQKKSFRQICRSIFKQIKKCPYVKGIRIGCSGRLNGAEIAKTECKKYGETSLHVFSDQIDYAKTQASTPYGILGVKVWVSYFLTQKKGTRSCAISKTYKIS
uniref:ribosomal protein S3 n=1 Tax=Pellia neesiana TaxID=70144 RepID=UPI0025803927|nr:ribosomal protein S3 [Pellia neesiana]WIA66953.1 ribosomal protein S3 [Pellia neesiana]WIA66994.1 ribosomal protein S3 [Pellia neesiana]WIA67035.1 ribosomal protein S3 [Pellia neesiana]